MERKSARYEAPDLEKAEPERWSRLSDPLGSDVAYQARHASAIISVNSSCRARREPASIGAADPARLRSLSNRYFLGMTHPTLEQERLTEVSRVPALETTRAGMLATGTRGVVGPIMIQSVVFESEDCSYGLLCVAPPGEAREALAEFARFRQGFRLTSER